MRSKVAPILLVILVTLGFNVQAGDPASIPADKEVIEFATMLGTVTFGHKAHASLEGVECKACHHTATEGAPMMACHMCHKSPSTGAPEPKDAFHKVCQGCHKEMEAAGKKSGPSANCTKCHVK